MVGRRRRRNDVGRTSEAQHRISPHILRKKKNDLLILISQARAPAPPQIIPTEDTPTSSLVDVDSAQVHTVPHDFKSQEIKTETQKERIEHDAERLEAQAIAQEQKLKKEFHEKEQEAKKVAKDAKKRVEKNSDNPVVIGNAVAVVALSAGLGLGAYRKYIAGELTWKVVGAWAGVVGLFAAGDYYLSK